MVRTSVALLEGTLAGCAVDASTVWVIVGHLVVAVEIPSLPRAETCSIRYEALLPPAKAPAEATTVAFVLPGSLVLNHPRLGGLRWLRTPENPPVDRGIR